jgi:hypothetical protein
VKKAGKRGASPYPVRNYDNSIKESGEIKRGRQLLGKEGEKRLFFLIKDRRFAPLARPKSLEDDHKNTLVKR